MVASSFVCFVFCFRYVSLFDLSFVRKLLNNLLSKFESELQFLVSDY